MARKDRQIHLVTNPIFLEDSPSFLSKDPGDRDLATEPVFQRQYGIPEIEGKKVEFGDLKTLEESVGLPSEGVSRDHPLEVIEGRST
jgi:hypothetical protein